MRAERGARFPFGLVREACFVLPPVFAFPFDPAPPFLATFEGRAGWPDPPMDVHRPLQAYQITKTAGNVGAPPERATHTGRPTPPTIPHDPPMRPPNPRFRRIPRTGRPPPTSARAQTAPEPPSTLYSTHSRIRYRTPSSSQIVRQRPSSSGVSVVSTVVMVTWGTWRAASRAKSSIPSNASSP